MSAYGTQIVTYDSNGVPSQNLGDAKVLEGLNFTRSSPTARARLSNRRGRCQLPQGQRAMAIDGLYEIPKMMNDPNVSDVVKNNWDIAPIPLAAATPAARIQPTGSRLSVLSTAALIPDAVAAFALHMSTSKGDNVWESSLNEEQACTHTPYYANINYANYAYGTLGEDYVTMDAENRHRSRYLSAHR